MNRVGLFSSDVVWLFHFSVSFSFLCCFSGEQMINIDKELTEVDQTLERSIAAVQAQ